MDPPLERLYKEEESPPFNIEQERSKDLHSKAKP